MLGVIFEKGRNGYHLRSHLTGKVKGRIEGCLQRDFEELEEEGGGRELGKSTSFVRRPTSIMPR